MIDDRILEELENFREGLDYEVPPDWIGRAPGQPIVLIGRAVLCDVDLNSIVEAAGGKLITQRELPCCDITTSAIAPAVGQPGATSARASMARETIVLNDPLVTDAPDTLAQWIRYELEFERLRTPPCNDPIIFKNHMDQVCRRLIHNIEAWLRWRKDTRKPRWLSNPPHDPAGHPHQRMKPPQSYDQRLQYPRPQIAAANMHQFVR
jgi:hypothetical protein